MGLGRRKKEKRKKGRRKRKKGKRKRKKIRVPRKKKGKKKKAYSLPSLRDRSETPGALDRHDWESQEANLLPRTVLPASRQSYATSTSRQNYTFKFFYQPKFFHKHVQTEGSHHHTLANLCRLVSKESQVPGSVKLQR